jgi:hypothetical protein
MDHHHLVDILPIDPLRRISVESREERSESSNPPASSSTKANAISKAVNATTFALSVDRLITDGQLVKNVSSASFSLKEMRNAKMEIHAIDDIGVFYVTIIMLSVTANVDYTTIGFEKVIARWITASIGIRESVHRIIASLSIDVCIVVWVIMGVRIASTR